MSDWQAGDLALCIGEPKGEKEFVWKPRAGCVYTVMEVGRLTDGCVCLDFYEDPEYTQEWAYDAIFFRKVTPPKDMQLDSEDIRIGEPA